MTVSEVCEYSNAKSNTSLAIKYCQEKYCNVWTTPNDLNVRHPTLTPLR
jgi:hypothetical protein